MTLVLGLGIALMFMSAGISCINKCTVEEKIPIFLMVWSGFAILSTISKVLVQIFIAHKYYNLSINSSQIFV